MKKWIFAWVWLIASCLGTLRPMYAQLPTGMSGANIPVRVDQFGYEPNARKWTILVDPQTGYNSSVSFDPNASFQVRRSSDNLIVFTGTPVLFNSGNTDANSGDKVWHADFSSLTTPGTYYVWSNNQRSYDFEIRTNIYKDVLRHALRFFYYQRQGIAITSQYGGNWNHAGSHSQDATATDYFNPGSNPRNMIGGWWDAGDNTKYVSFAPQAIWNLAHAYEYFPSAFTDDLNIPESGNGLPDILDEMKYEVDWILRMQNSNGGVHNRVTNQGAGCDLMNNPTNMTKPRYYTAVTSWSTASAAMMFATLARFTAYNTVYPGYTTTLTQAAENAWTWLEANPNLTPSSGRDDSGNNISCGANGGADAATDKAMRVHAAATLYTLTGKAKYLNYFNANRKPLTNWGALDLGTYSNADWYAYWDYCKSPNADPAIVADLRNKVKTPNLNQNVNNWAYRTYERGAGDGFWWGFTQNPCDAGSMNFLPIILGADPGNDTYYIENAAEYFHLLLGRNPNNFCYFTNLGSKGGPANLGVENPVMQPFHKWWGEDDGVGANLYDGLSSTYGPVPGALTGGPNAYYSGTTSPPKNQPRAKSFKDANSESEMINSWEISEVGIYYQARAINLIAGLAHYNTPSSPTVPTAPSNLAATAVSTSQIDLSWTNTATNHTANKVERATASGGPWTEIGGSLAASATSYSATGLTASTTYYFRVRASNSAGNSGYSNTANATTQSGGGGGSTTTYVYADALATDWQDWSWGSTRNLSNTSPVYAGGNSVRIDYTDAYGGFSPRKGTAATGSNLAEIRFWVHASAVRNMNFYTQTADGSGNSSTVAFTTNANAWKEVVITAAQLGNPASIKRITLQANGFTGTVYVDELRLIYGSAPTQYTLTVNAVNGSVGLSPTGGTYASGTVVSLTATPNSGYQFTGWSGDASGTSNPLSITMNSNKTVTANFTQQSASSCRFQAESAALAGTFVSTTYPGYDGTGYADGLDQTGDKITWTLNGIAAGSYDIRFRYSICNTQQNFVYINGSPYNGGDARLVFSDNITSPGCGNASDWEFVVIPNKALSAGHTIEVRKDWGYTPIDYLELVPAGTGRLAAPAASLLTVGISPNPGSGIVMVSVEGAYEGPADIQVHTLDGRAIGAVAVEKSGAILMHKLDLSHASAGVYLITVRAGNEIRHLRYLRQ
ncbi:MAG: hypothetical protein OHK0039_10990 [Bacteroidia bacterium]